MPSKKTTRARAAKPGHGKRKIGLTSALGPKMTTALVLVVLTGGLMLGAHERSAAKATSDRGPSMAADPADTATKPSAKATSGKAHATTPASDAAAAATDAASPTPKTPVTTIAGCLDRDGDTFRLKDTTGADAPKSRSWKSGFIKKGAATVDVLDRGNSLGLSSRVGERVSVTGTLVDRVLQARSVRRISSSCTN